MSYIEKARQNKVNADKAQALDDLQNKQREQQVYDFGREDGNVELLQMVERMLAEQASFEAPLYSLDRGLAHDFVIAAEEKRNSDGFKEALHTVKQQGWAPDVNDPYGDISAVDKHLFEQNMKKGKY